MHFELQGTEGSAGEAAGQGPPQQGMVQQGYHMGYPQMQMVCF